MKTKYTRIKKNSQVTYKYNGMLFSAKYISRQKHSGKLSRFRDEWIYNLQNPDGSISPFFANDIQLIFYGAE